MKPQPLEILNAFEANGIEIIAHPEAAKYCGFKSATVDIPSAALFWASMLRSAFNSGVRNAHLVKSENKI